MQVCVSAPEHCEKYCVELLTEPLCITNSCDLYKSLSELQYEQGHMVADKVFLCIANRHQPRIYSLEICLSPRILYYPISPRIHLFKQACRWRFEGTLCSRWGMPPYPTHRGHLILSVGLSNSCSMKLANSNIPWVQRGVGITPICARGISEPVGIMTRLLNVSAIGASCNLRKLRTLMFEH